MPSEKVLVQAKKIIEILVENMYQAVMYAAFYERVTLNSDVAQAFGESRETWGIVKSQEAFLDALILCLSRIIDGTGENTASLEQLFKLINGDGFLQVLVDKCVEDNSKHGRDGLEKSCMENIGKFIEELNQLYGSVKGSHYKSAVHSHRNTRIGHIAVEFDVKKHRTLKYGDPLKLLDDVIPLIDLASQVVCGMAYEMEGYKEEAAYTADLYWRHVARLPEHENSNKKAKTVS